jgi:hypothetical protein
MAGCGAAGSEVKSVFGRLVHEQDPQVAIAALLGHGTHTMTSRYIHHVDTALIAAVDSVQPHRCCAQLPQYCLLTCWLCSAVRTPPDPSASIGLGR